jgi:beta-N-acetylhexosaminidase
LTISKLNVGMLKKVFLIFLWICSVSTEAWAQQDKNSWVDSVFNSLSVDERIGQLFVVPVPAKASESTINKIENQIKSKEVGGVIFDSLGPLQQAKFTNRFQAASQVPLLIAQEAVVGLGQRRDSTVHIPDAYIVGAARSDSMAYLVGKEIARKMKLLGAHVNVSSFAEIGTDVRDSISQYSFGQNERRVASKATAFMKGLQDQGVLAVVKNFSIKGATVLDVRDNVPVIEASIDSVTSFPFFKLFENNVAGFMAAESSFPLFYQDKDLVRKNELDAAAISTLLSGNWMRDKQEFDGLVWVPLHNRDESEENNKGDIEVLAFQSGNDLIISTGELGPAIRKIKRLTKKDESYEALLTKSVRKVLSAKYDAGLWTRPVANTDNLMSKLNSPEASLVSQKLYEAAITVIQDHQNLIPISTLENRKFVYLNTIHEGSREFYEYLSKYVHTNYFELDNETKTATLLDSIEDQHTVIIGIFPETPQTVLHDIATLAIRAGSRHQVILCDFGNKEFLQSTFPNVTVITAYQGEVEASRAVPQIIFGGLKASGVLPFTYSAVAPEGAGIETEALQRLSYSIPEDAEMSSKTLEKIEMVVNEAIAGHATPGCQVLVARNGKVIYDRSFGGLTYDNTDSVTSNVIYDLASLTKVSATLQTVMFMYEKGLIDLHKKMSHYLPELKNTNKRDITLVEVLTHQAGLAPFIPMWTETVKDNVFLPQYYSRIQSEVYPLQVSPDLYAAPIIRDSVWAWIGDSKMQNRPPRTPYTYQYSDLGFLLLQRLAETMFNQSIDEFLAQNLYEPLGAYTTGFTPLSRFSSQQIAPTEDDKIYRKTHIAGTVHDERAAMMGGVAGHAGLFSNATDLSKLGQMLLQGGSYGGYQYYKPETVELFALKQFDKSRRGLGWDKPVQSEWNSPTSLKASPKTFGHTGFTGTCIWIDPEFNLLYIFLSNRVYPDRSGKLITSNIRSRIQDVVYEAIFDYCAVNP